MVSADSTIVLVTGGNGGIGREIVKALAAEQPSYHILMGTRNIEKGKEAVASLGAPSNVSVIQLDVTSDSSIEACAKSIQRDYGRLDVLVNNAGIAGLDLPENMPIREKWRAIFEVNVTSVAILTESMAPLLELSSRPSVVMISSGLGSVELILTRQQYHDWMPYSPSKGALNNMTANFVRKYPRWKVNACNPGLCATGLNRMWDNPRAKPASEGARVAINLCVDMGKEDGPNGISLSNDGPEPW